MEKLTHWKKEVNKDYLGSWDFVLSADESGKPVYEEKNLTIKKVEKTLVTDMEQIKKGVVNGKKEELLIWFNELEKPMICHAKTNFKGLETATGTPFVELWIGKKVCVYVEKNVKAFGTTTDALRIKPVVKRLCEVCGKIITEEVYNGSIKKYGRAFCSAECKEKGEK